MPELPDLELYLHALRPRLVGQSIERVRIASPFLVRTTTPPVEAVCGRAVSSLSRVGKRIVIDTEGVFLVIHLMVAGRLQWKPASSPTPRRLGLMAIDVGSGTLLLTEAGSTRRASVHMAADLAALSRLDPGGLELLTASLHEFCDRLGSERHTLKRSLTDPHLFSGVGNAYSDEILHRAGLSPLRLSDALNPAEQRRLFEAARAVLVEWRDRLIEENGDGFPAKVTAFRRGMAVHGRFGRPCPACGTPVQRLRYATNEANYCPQCQTDGRLLADRGLSRLLQKDWPRTLDELERRYDAHSNAHLTPASPQSADSPAPNPSRDPDPVPAHRDLSRTQAPRAGGVRHGHESADVVPARPQLGERGRQRGLIKRHSS